LQVCNNFNDPGVQHYGGDLFRSICDEADDIFCKLPAPKPTALQRQLLWLKWLNFSAASFPEEMPFHARL